MFIWDFVASTVLDNIMDWFYGQVVGFLGNFFAEMGNMGVELFQQNWVQSIVLFFSYLAWALYVTGLVVAGFRHRQEGVWLPEETSQGEGGRRRGRVGKAPAGGRLLFRMERSAGYAGELLQDQAS